MPQIKKVCTVALQRYRVRNEAQREQLNNARPPFCILDRSAIMALCKIMSVSSELCAQNLQTIFELLQSQIDFGAKSNIIISLGDLFNRFPNLLNEHSRNLFNLLHDEDNHVRR